MHDSSASRATAIDPAAIPRGLFIGGMWREATGGKTIPVSDPSTEESLGTIADATVEDGLAAVAAASEAAADWAKTAPRKRADILMKAFHLMLAKADGLAELISRENGKALADAKGEVNYAAEFFRGLYSKKSASAYLDALAGVQEHLGALNDAVVAKALIARLGKSSKDLSPEVLARADGIVTGWIAARIKSDLEELPGVWDEFRRRKPFWK
ncbi:MAG: aldehyde dehydrogenase family protein [Alphaproteobacteria bacterium]|nr:aldehyde dehydrogenase family protein [Alphaproteobacteria bacterium]